MFVIHTNDIEECVEHAMLLLFADDVKMVMTITSSADTRCLQIDINNLLKWSERNRLPLNPGKCSVITLRRTRDYHSAIYRMGDHEIGRKEEVRDLGLPIDAKMTFATHIEQVTTKSRQSMGYIKWISKGQFGTRTLKVLYTA